MSTFVKLTGALTALALCVAVVGLLLGWAWYHDDACPIEEWKCDLGGIGFGLSIYAGLAVAPLLLMLAVAGGIAVARRRSGARTRN